MKPCTKCGVFHTRDVACFVVGQTARATRQAQTTRLNTVKRFVITHVGADVGLRRLTFAKQGRFIYGTRREADLDLEQFRGPDGLPRVLRPDEMETLEVREVDCYAGHHDPVRYYVDEDQDLHIGTCDFCRKENTPRLFRLVADPDQRVCDECHRDPRIPTKVSN